MAVIISTSDPIPTNSAPQANNDTSWMQDLVIEQKTETIPETSPTIQDIEKTIEPAKTIKKIDPVEVATVIEEPKKDPIITNMYIAADQANNKSSSSPKEQIITNEIKSIEPKPTNTKAIDLDELFGNTKTGETTNYIAPKEQAASMPQESKTNNNDHHTLQKIVFGLAGSLAIIAGVFFVIKTMFPLEINNTPTTEVIVDTGTTIEEPTEEIHPAPPVKTLAEVYTEKLTAYASSGEFYHQFGRETKNRNLIRYGLFIHKKSLDLQEDIQKAIVLSGQIDTVSIEAYLAQFDEYVGILEETVANDPELQTAMTTFTGPSSETEDNGNFAPQTSETEQNTDEQVNTQPTLDQFLNQVTQPQ